MSVGVGGQLTWGALRALWAAPHVSRPPCPRCGGPTLTYSVGANIFNGTIGWACPDCDLGCRTAVSAGELHAYVTRVTGQPAHSEVQLKVKGGGRGTWTT